MVGLNHSTYSEANGPMFRWDLGWETLSFSHLRECFSLTFELLYPVSDVSLTALFASSLKQKEQSLC